MEPRREPLVMYGGVSDAPRLEWGWARDQLVAAGSYWVVPSGSRPPHPRPVWGVWSDDALHLSIGSPVIQRSLTDCADVTVHLGDANDVVIVEGSVTGETEGPELVRAYDDKYDWEYIVEQYGPLTTVAPTTVLAWRSAGWAGRGGFQQTGRWVFATTDN